MNENELDLDRILDWDEIPTYIVPMLNTRTMRLMNQQDCFGMFMTIVNKIHNTDEEITTRAFDSRDWTTSVGIKSLIQGLGWSNKKARRQLDRLVQMGVISLNCESIPEVITLTLDDTNLRKPRHG
jgi:hypothetical protein